MSMALRVPILRLSSHRLLDDKYPVVQRTYNGRYKPDGSRRKLETRVTDKRTRLKITADLLGDMKKPLPLRTPTNPVDNTDWTSNWIQVDRRFKERRKLLTEDWWSRNKPLKYERWFLKSRKNPVELSLGRRMLNHLLAERSGHGDFKAYHIRFSYKPGSWKTCKCGKPRK